MRLWSLHASHLDRAGLVAAWREALLAQAVLAGRTRGYQHHPQLERFRAHENPLDAVGAYLGGLHAEATRRGYTFNSNKIIAAGENVGPIEVWSGQLDFEWQHLGVKLATRSPSDAVRWQHETVTPHPLFIVVPGGIASWERP